jgi:hypothetical protein
MIEIPHYPATKMNTNLVLTTVGHERRAKRRSALRAAFFSRRPIVVNKIICTTQPFVIG